MSYNTRNSKDKMKESNQNVTISIDELKKVIMEAVSQETKQLFNEIKELKNQISELKNEINRNTVTHKNLNEENNLKIFNLEMDTSSETIIEMDHMLKQTAEKPNQQKTEDTKTARVQSKWRTIRGTNEVTDSEEVTLAAAPRMIWLYVGRCDPSTTMEQVQTFLERKCPNNKFEVVKLDSKGKTLAFKVGANQSLENKLYDPFFWPKDIIIKRFKFFKKTATFESTG